MMLVSPWLLPAQILTEREVLELDQIDIIFKQEVSLKANQAFIEQIGNQNALLLIQSQLAPRESNRLDLFQYGSSNYADLYIKASGTETILNQTGHGNQFFLQMLSKDSDFDFLQLGNDNFMAQNYGYLYDSGLTVIQEGNNNEFIQSIKSPSSIEMTIKQIGSGISMKVTNN